MNSICSFCGGLFRVKASAVHYRHHCSRLCYGKHMRQQSADNFWKLVDISAGEKACWPFLGTILDDGYGQCMIAGIRGNAHRHAYQLTYGKLLSRRQLVLHHCDYRRCCNPKHLYEGTHQDNWDDIKAHGDYRVGASHGRARLSDEQVAELKQHRINGISIRELMQQYNIGETTARRLIKEGYRRA